MLGVREEGLRYVCCGGCRGGEEGVSAVQDQSEEVGGRNWLDAVEACLKVAGRIRDIGKGGLGDFRLGIIFALVCRFDFLGARSRT